MDEAVEHVAGGGAGDLQETGQLMPAFEHVLDGLTQARIGLHLLFIELGLQPDMQFLHERPALGLVIEQAAIVRHSFLPGDFLCL